MPQQEKSFGLDYISLKLKSQKIVTLNVSDNIVFPNKMVLDYTDLNQHLVCPKESQLTKHMHIDYDNSRF